MKDGKSVRTIPEKPTEWLTCDTLEDWRAWLSCHHQEGSGVWLKIRKVRSVEPGVLLDEAVTEALRFGWIDGKMYSLDREGIIVRFTPRRRGSLWSARNRKRAESLIAEGRMLEPGMAAIREAMDNGKWESAYTALEEPALPSDLEAELLSDPPASENFRDWPNSDKLQVVIWIAQARREETRRKRIREVVGLAHRGMALSERKPPSLKGESMRGNGAKTAVLGNGVNLSYLEKGDPQGIPLILLPGIADSFRVFDLLLGHLPDDLHVLALSPRGHGDSDAPQSGYRTADFSKDLELFMDVLGLDKGVILGASSGGFVARHFAITCPDRTLGLVLLGSPAMLSDKPAVKKAWDEAISRLTDPVDPGFIRGFAKEDTQDLVPEDFREMMIGENLKVPARVWIQTTEGLLEETFPDDLARIGSPALLLWGEKDTIVTRAEQEGVASEIRGARLVVLEGLGHMLYWEGPERVAKEIEAFVRGIRRREGPEEE